MSSRGRVAKTASGLASVVVVAGLVLAAEAFYVTQREYLPADSAPPTTADVSSDREGGTSTERPLRLVVLGDSTAAGIGASTTSTSIGGRMAAIVADETGRLVELRSVARSGARAADLKAQVSAALELRPHVVLLIIGANDATHMTALDSVEDDLRAAVDRLIRAGAEVVVGTCPDLGGARAFPQPLREIAAQRGFAVARVEGRAVKAAGGRVVDLAKLTGPAFREDPRTVSRDKFHPSDRGYRLWAEALTPALRAAARAVDQGD